MLPWQQLYIITYHGSMRINCNHTLRKLFCIYLLLHLEVLQLFWLGWSGMTMSGLWGFKSVVVEESSLRLNAEPYGSYGPHHSGPGCQPWHQETWKSLKQLYTLGYILLLRRDTPVNISNCFWLRLQLGSSLFCAWTMCAHECFRNVISSRSKGTFRLNRSFTST